MLELLANNKVWILYFMFLNLGMNQEMKIQKIGILETKAKCQNLGDVLRGKMVILRPITDAEGNPIQQSTYFCEKIDQQFYHINK